MDNWIIFERDVRLDDFIERNQPSKIEFVNMGVFAGDPKQRPKEFEYPHSIPEPQKTALLQQWEETTIKKPWTIQKLAKEYSYMSGKWLIYCPRSEIDALWAAIVKAVLSDTLGTAANVFQGDESKTYFVICVYTTNFKSKEEVWATEKSLRKLGITGVLRYKPNIYTTLDIYAGNEWSIRPTLYYSGAYK